MAENFGIFIGVPLPDSHSLRTLIRTLIRTTVFRRTTRLEQGRVVPAGLDVENVEGMPVLDEALMRAGLLELGADLPQGEDEGSWSHGTVAYDFLFCRGRDELLRMVDGTMYYPGRGTGIQGGDVRAVFTGLLELAEVAGARLWQTAGVVVPEALGRDEVDWWVREMRDVSEDPSA